MIRSRGFLAAWGASAIVSVAAASTALPQAATQQAAGRDCGAYAVRARVGGHVVCLRDLQRCRARLVAHYRRFGFRCTNGFLVASWRRLRRPLHIPSIAPNAPCPTSAVDDGVNFARYGVGPGIGTGPVYPTPFDSRDQRPLSSMIVDPTWRGGKHAFLILPAYHGPVLIRGHQLDGPGEVSFSSNEIPGAARYPARSAELRIPAFRNALVMHTFFFLDPPGCFAYQIDGTTFSKIVTFEVRVH